MESGAEEDALRLAYKERAVYPKTWLLVAVDLLSEGGRMKARSAKAKGSRVERQIASMLGGKRTPLSGAAADSLPGDVTLPEGSIWRDWSWEVKARARMSWTTAWQALGQATIAKRQNQKPAAVLKEDRGRPVFVAYLDDVIEWGTALAQLGAGYSIMPCLTAIERNVDVIRKAVRQ